MSVKFTGENPDYLGDGLYASFDGYQVWLETSDGVSITNSVALEPSVAAALDNYRRRLGILLDDKVE